MTSSQGPDQKSPPSPVKIHYFEKKPRDGASEGRGHEDLAHARPTLPEFSLDPKASREPQELPAHARPTLPEFSIELRQGAAGGTGPLQDPPRLKERAATPSGIVSERLATARSLFSQGQLSQARDILEKLVMRGVGGAAAHSLLGTIYMAQGSLERALECFDEALTRDAEELTARLHRGEVRLQKGDLLLAQQDLQHVLEVGTAGSPLIEQARRLLQQLEEQRDRRRR